MPSSPARAPLGPGSSPEVSPGSPQLPGFQGEMGIGGWDGEGVPYPASPSAFLFSEWPGGEGRQQRTPGAPSAPPQTPIFLGPGSAQGAQPECPAHRCPVPRPRASSGRVAWAPVGGRRHLDSCRSLQASPVSPSAHPGEQGGWERRGRTLEDWARGPCTMTLRPGACLCGRLGLRTPPGAPSTVMTVPPPAPPYGSPWHRRYPGARV